MPVTPHYAGKMMQIGCPSSIELGAPSEALTEMQNQLEEQKKQIEALKLELSTTQQEIKKLMDSLVEVSDLNGEISFFAINSEYKKQAL